jgi:hypothetical protein
MADNMEILNDHNDLPNPENLEIPEKFGYDSNIPPELSVNVSGYNGLDRTLYGEIVMPLKLTKAENKLITGAALELAKVGGARENYLNRIVKLKADYLAKNIPKGMRVKISGIKNPERAAEVLLTTNLTVMRTELEYLLANYVRLNNRFAEIYPTLLQNLKSIIDKLTYALGTIDFTRIDLPGLAPFDVEAITQDVLRRACSLDCLLNPRAIKFLELYCTHTSNFQLNEIEHAKRAQIKENKAAERKQKFEQTAADKASKLFTAAHAETIDDKLNTLVNYINSKNSKGKGKKSGPPSTSLANQGPHNKSAAAGASTPRRNNSAAAGASTPRRNRSQNARKPKTRQKSQTQPTRNDGRRQ